MNIGVLETKNIIIDVGMTYVKCGFAKDSVPMHIVPTPLPLLQALREDLNSVSYVGNKASKEFNIIFFAYSILHHHSRQFLMIASNSTYRLRNY